MRITRRKAIQTLMGTGAALFVHQEQASADGGQSHAPDRRAQDPPKTGPGKSVKVAAVQLRSRPEIEKNIERHRHFIHRSASTGARVVVFPECSVTGYNKKAIAKDTLRRLEEAERSIAEAAKEAGVYVIAGAPTPSGDGLFNSAVVITPAGKILERYHKIQLAGEQWAIPGEHMSVFPIDGILCSIIICHDERYPELVRLPVLAGARIVFYISHESGMEEKKKIAPYRAQIQARAVENSVFVVHANAPADKRPRGGSHGQSRIILPDGNIVAEAGHFEEDYVEAVLDLDSATGNLARRSGEFETLKDWWQHGVAKVRRIT